MFKKIFFIVLIMSQWSLVRSQTISRQVISNGGGTLSGGGNQITFNIGETVIPSFGVGSILMTQGFEQPGEQITTGVVSLINCPGVSITVPFTSVDILAGNTYTAQLSNSVGSFASPVNIGTLAGNGSSGSINITIPLNTPPGNGYRIRVVGSMPQTVGSSNSNGMLTVVSPLEYTYVEAGNPFQALFPLVNAMNIAQRPTGTSIMVRPICNTIPIGSVDMTITGPGLNWTILQNVEPFALFDNFGNNIYGQVLAPGTYSLTVTGYLGDNRTGGTTYGPVLTTFTIAGTAPTISMPTFAGTAFCAGTTVNVSFTTTGVFAGGNIFNVLLSDANGSFVTPQIIGTTNTAGVVLCTIPIMTVGGENYKIKVVSTDPAAAGNYNLAALTIHPVVMNLVSPTNDYPVGTATKQAIQTINASNNITGLSIIRYKAGNAINLTPGFQVVAHQESSFKAEIVGCN